MAIQIDLPQSQFGVAFPAAYFRLVTASIQRQRDPAMRHTVAMVVIGYATKPQDEDTREVADRRYYAPLAEVEAMPGEGFVAKCYAWVMQQADMAGCIAA